jgi:hypothetical protein
MDTRPSKRGVTFTFKEASRATAAEFRAPAKLPTVAGTRTKTDLLAMETPSRSGRESNQENARQTTF